MRNRVHFIMTGGTIDKVYDPISQSNVMNEESKVPFLIQERVRAEFYYSFDTVCMLDSNQITHAHREDILRKVDTCDTKHIVITHGTDTMSQTAEFLKTMLKSDNDKTIILTGSLIPINGFLNSDAGFNLGFAVSSSILSEPGVYICIHGRIFEAGKVQKNLDIARFEKI